MFQVQILSVQLYNKEFRPKHEPNYSYLKFRVYLPSFFYILLISPKSYKRISIKKKDAAQDYALPKLTGLTKLTL